MLLNGLEMDLTDSGEGLPIVLLHGLALDKSIWSPMVAAYASQARFITPDLRGHGKTSVGQADGTLGQIRLTRSIRLLSNRYAANIFNATQCVCTISVIA